MSSKTKKKDKRKVSLRSKLTFAVIMNYLILGAFVMLTVTALFFYSVVRARYSDNVDMAKTIEDTVISQVDLSKLVDAVIEQERTDTEAFKKRVFVNDAPDQDGQLLSYKWYTEENPTLAKRADYQYVEDVLYAFNRNNKNLNGTSLMVFDKKTHIASLLCDVEKFGAETPTRTDYVMWRNFADEDLEHIEDERWSLLKNLHRYMRVDPKYVVFIWYEPVAYEDEDHLCIVMADVAGKGIPTALFMVNSMQTIRARAASGGTPAEILYDVNNMLFKGNKEKMFVTVWFAILTLSTGEVIETNAGHENPAIKDENGEFVYLERKHCFVLGARKNMKYRDDTFNLNPGDSLFIYTDGVTEATNAFGERFFGERLLTALNEVKDQKPEEILHHMKGRIDGFVDGAPQFDDLTMLAVTYRGK